MIVLDIETAPISTLPPPPESIIDKGTGNLKDPAKIEAKREANQAAWVERAALDWRLGQIVAVGLLPFGKEPVTLVRGTGNEADMLAQAWELLKNGGEVIGFNLRSFDLPFLLGRSAVNGIRPTRRFQRARFRTDLGIIDWCEILSDWGNFDMTGWSLEQYASFFGLKTTAYGSGAEVPERWAAGDYDYINNHLVADLLMCKELHELFAPAFL